MTQNNQKRLSRRLLALLLCAVMLCGILPAAAAADYAEAPTIVAANLDYAEFEAAVVAQLDEIHYQAEADVYIDARPFTQFSPLLTDALAQIMRDAHNVFHQRVRILEHKGVDVLHKIFLRLSVL